VKRDRLPWTGRDRVRTARAYASALLRVLYWAGLLAPPAVVGAPTAGRIRAVERMPALPEPLVVRDWPALSRAYYLRVLDPAATGLGWPAVQADEAPGFRLKSYLGAEPADEAMTCLSAVAGARLAGLDPRALHGRDWVAACAAWFDPNQGLYRHTRAERSPVLHADIHGYYPSILGLILAAQFPEDTGLRTRADAVVTTFHAIARGLGCPERPDFDVLGWDLAAGRPGGRPEPMNRLGHAPAVAWILAVGADRGGAEALRASARAALQWQLDHPGRYEVTHLMGPLAAARLNARPGPKVDLHRLLDIWFGEGPIDRHPWAVTAGTRCGGITCDGLDGARWPEGGFYAFTMGSLQGPAWLVPVAVYEPRFARAIGRYALHAANSARLLQGDGLDADREDHPEWKARWDPGDLMFYEGLKSWDPAPERRFRPYATGDPVLLGWGGRTKPDPACYHEEKAASFAATADNISLYMGNHVGFLGGIVATTEAPGVLIWDVRKTDWFHEPAWPAFLIFNPHAEERTITLETGPAPVAVFDLVAGEELHASATGRQRVRLSGDTARVLILHPAGARREMRGSMLYAAGALLGGTIATQPDDEPADQR
jgi:hypothetical protein